MITESPLEPLALGALLRSLRLEAGLTQRQLAARLHTSHSAVSRLEAGRHLPRLETLASYARILHRPLYLNFNGPTGRSTVRTRIP